MDTGEHMELKRLRRVVEALNAIDELNAERAANERRYKRGVRKLMRYAADLKEEDTPMFNDLDVTNPEVLKLITNPTLANIPPETAV